jgi:hypothetical protein
MSLAGVSAGGDRFRMREVERHLTAELHFAKEQQRLLEVRIRDYQTNDVEPNPDQDRSLAELHARHLEAARVHGTALQRFTDFASHGIIPQDLTSNDCARNATAARTSGNIRSDL